MSLYKNITISLCEEDAERLAHYAVEAMKADDSIVRSVDVIRAALAYCYGTSSLRDGTQVALRLLRERMEPMDALYGRDPQSTEKERE